MKLSDKEWRVLNALWVAPEGLALGAVVDALRPDTGWSRSTVLTYLTRMEAKGLLPKGASANYTMVRFDMTHTPTGLPSEADIKTFADWMKASRILKKDPAYGDVVFQ
jgi:NitT/TauT family transport system substrate-binding protein